MYWNNKLIHFVIFHIIRFVPFCCEKKAQLCVYIFALPVVRCRSCDRKQESTLAEDDDVDPQQRSLARVRTNS